MNPEFSSYNYTGRIGITKNLEGQLPMPSHFVHTACDTGKPFYTSSLTNIEKMVIKLAATSLKMQVSEPDAKISPSIVPGYSRTLMEESFQAKVYNDVVASYLGNVPAEQNGMAVCGLSPNGSWFF